MRRTAEPVIEEDRPSPSAQLRASEQLGEVAHLVIALQRGLSDSWAAKRADIGHIEAIAASLPPEIRERIPTLVDEYSALLRLSTSLESGGLNLYRRLQQLQEVALRSSPEHRSPLSESARRRAQAEDDREAARRRRGRALASLRVAVGLDLESAARAAGASVRELAGWERGFSRAGIKIQRLLRVYGASADALEAAA